MTIAKPMTKCPFCLEPIAPGARRCKHCHADLAEKVAASKPTGFRSFRAGFLVGVAFSIVMAMLIYGHFKWGY